MTMSRMEVRGDLLRVEALDGDYLKLSIVTTAYVFTYTIRRDELEGRIRGTEQTVVYVPPSNRPKHHKQRRQRGKHHQH